MKTQFLIYASRKTGLDDSSIRDILDCKKTSVKGYTFKELK